MPDDDHATATLQDRAYPAGTFASLIDTPFVTAPTRAALLARAGAPRVTAPRFLSPDAFALLGAVCDRLLDQDEGSAGPHVDLAGALDAVLASGATDGWRYDALPNDGDAMRRGLAGIDETAEALRGARFTALPPGSRDAVLAAVQAGDPPGETWRRLPAKRFFEDLLAAATEAFYAHPSAQDEIGYAGYADARGWQAIGLGEREPREPEPVAAPPRAAR